MPFTYMVNKCPNCETEIEPGFEICWKCRYSFADHKIIETVIAGQNHFEGAINCLRCGVPMVYAGQRKIQDRIHWTTVGNLFELLSNMDSFDLYVCPKCNKVEFFLSLPNSQENNESTIS